MINENLAARWEDSKKLWRKGRFDATHMIDIEASGIIMRQQIDIKMMESKLAKFEAGEDLV